MVNGKMLSLGKNRSVIREIFEYAKIRAAQVGEENVFDFSIGNPSAPAPKEVSEAIVRAVNETPAAALHGYTSAQGDKSVRDTIAKKTNARHNARLSGGLIYMTCGAAASLTIALKALTVSEQDEFITFAPYFTEYKVFVENAGAKLTVLPSDENFMPDLYALARAINKNVRGVLINSPNNPSGVVYGEETLEKLAALLTEKSKEFGAPVYLISDEPYRELVYDGENVPFITNFYENSVICYSYSKSLSLPGERIGYIAVNPECMESGDVYAAIMGAGRSLGYVCAPALFQRVAAECDGLTADLGVYKRNRTALYDGLTKLGFSCVRPSGAFYLFMKSPEADAYAFCERAKKYDLLFVPSDDFGVKGYVRIAYCVPTEKIERAMPRFEMLAKEYGL